MSLRSTARDVRVPVAPNFQGPPSVAAESAILAERFDPAKTFATIDADALVARLRSIAHQGAWSSISFREWKNAAWVLVSGQEPLAAEPKFLAYLFAEYRERKKRTAYLGLILAYIRDYDPKNPAIGLIANEIREVIDEFGWEWSARHKKYGLFSPKDGPRRIAKACLWESGEPHQTLVDAGIGGARSFGGLAAYAYREALDELRATLDRQRPEMSVVDRILQWSVGENGLIYPAHRAALAESLLLPWAAKSPADDLREKISSFLLKHFRDPRLPINAKDWIGVREDAVAVLRKWLTGVALEQFFVVVDQVAQEHMWRFRRSFWLAYYNIDTIDDAWVLFGSDALTYARRAFGKTQSYGLLEKSYQVQSNHSVLLMRIGKLTISEWSHNGKCYIWQDGNPKAPKLYRGRYARDELIQGSNNEGQVHHGSEYGTWQRKIESYIRKQTRISVNERAYMPEEWRR